MRRGTWFNTFAAECGAADLHYSHLIVNGTCNLMMPEASGFDVARALRETEHTANIPILVLTAKDLTAEDRARLNGGVSAILPKASFKPGELIAEVRRALPAHVKV